jgi:hypothetical protein
VHARVAQPHGRIGAVAAGAIKTRARGRYMQGVRRIPVGIAAGIRLEVDPRSPVHIYLGTAEVEIARHLRRLARPGYACFDVGGHNAYYAMVLARLTHTRVTSFEFDPAGVARMRRNLALNPQLEPLVKIAPVYLSFETNAAVSADTVDGRVACGQDPRPDLLKIDVEGEEANVLRGARATLAHRPHLIIETHGASVERECCELLWPYGYRPKVVTQRRWLREHRAPDNRWLVAEGAPR